MQNQEATAVPLTLETTIGGHQLTLERLPQWEFHETGSKLLLTEHAHMLDESIKPQGLLVSIFMPDEADLALVAQAEDPCLALMHHIVAIPGYVGSADVMAPTAFQWSEHNAAYYTLNDNQGSVALVLAVCLQNGDIMVFNVSGPAAQAERLRSELPAILRTVQIEDEVLSGEGLDSLPNPLPFPPDEA